MPERYAYVSMLNGDNVYFLGALVFGYSLKKKTNHDMIIMVTPDVPDEQKKILGDYYDIVLDVEYVNIDPNLVKNYVNNRFKDMFTKLQCLRLTQYSKIIMIDIDMFVLGSMDEIFDLPPPAAAVRGKELKFGEKIPIYRIMRNGEMIGGINGGLLLLKPDENEYQKIMKDIYENPRKKEYKNAEQDYLSERYQKRWTNVSFVYNFQNTLLRKVLKYKFEEVHCIHYSWLIKPWYLLYSPDEFWAKIDRLGFGYDRRYYTVWLDAYYKLKEKYRIKGIDLESLFPPPKNLEDVLQATLRGVA